MEPRPKSFRIQGHNFSITCPQSNSTKEQLLDHFKTLGAEYILVAQEQHEDGGTHFHALVNFKQKKNIKSSNYFDYNNEHFNIQSTRNIKAWTKYIEKDGNFIESGVRPKQLTLTPLNPKRPLSQVGSDELRDYCVDNHIGYGYYLEEKTNRKKIDLSIYDEPQIGIMNMFLQALQVPDNLTIVLLGQTGCGKTSWAKQNCTKPGLLVRHIDGLKQFDREKHKSIIFDDMDFQHWPRTAQIHLVDQHDTSQINVKHSTATIPANIQKIFTCNIYPFAEDDAIKRRIKLINC